MGAFWTKNCDAIPLISSLALMSMALWPFFSEVMISMFNSSSKSNNISILCSASSCPLPETNTFACQKKLNVDNVDYEAGGISNMAISYIYLSAVFCVSLEQNQVDGTSFYEVEHYNDGRQQVKISEKRF